MIFEGGVCGMFEWWELRDVRWNTGGACGYAMWTGMA